MTKQQVIDFISKMPDNVTMKEILYSLHIIDKHNNALADIDANNVYCTDDVRKGVVIGK